MPKTCHRWHTRFYWQLWSAGIDDLGDSDCAGWFVTHVFVFAGASPVFTGCGDTMCNMFLCTVALLTKLCIFRKPLITNFQIIFQVIFYTNKCMYKHRLFCAAHCGVRVCAKRQDCFAWLLLYGVICWLCVQVCIPHRVAHTLQLAALRCWVRLLI